VARSAQVTKTAAAVFLSLIAGCVYSWLTIAATTDPSLLTNSTSSSLPIIQTAIPIADFYWAAPLILVAVYLYFHVYLHRIWSLL
jgi:hypothetical protein